MALIVWDARLETGHAAIDEQHQSLVEILNRLHLALQHGTGRQELESILVFLKDFAATHFAIEEGLMASHPYPEADQHRRSHADLVSQVSDLVARHQAGTVALTLAVMNFLEDWLLDHIRTEDRRFALELTGGAAS